MCHSIMIKRCKFDDAHCARIVVMDWFGFAYVQPLMLTSHICIGLHCISFQSVAPCNNALVGDDAESGDEGIRQ